MKSLLISKTTFLDFLFCAKNAWLKVHRSDLGYLFVPSEFKKQLMEQGKEVDAYARNLFPGGVTVPIAVERAVAETSRFTEEKVPAIFQATFVADGFIAKNDILAYNKKTKKWDLYEVKANNSIKEDGAVRSHIDDLAFQVSLLKRAGVPAGKFYIIHLNKDYRKRGDLEPQKLFKTADRTEIVLKKLPEIEAKMEAAKEYLAKKEEPKGNCDCIYRGRSQHCETFAYSNDVPEYSVHDLARIGASGDKLKILVEQGIFRIEDIPNHIEFTSEIQFNQIQVAKSKKPIINKTEIKSALAELKFPLYFFDYETFAPAIPAFDGFGPYQKIPFQFSLHILEKPDAELKHSEYLHTEFSDPSEAAAKLLQKHIGAKGTIIVWNKTFEAGVNKEIGRRLPKYQKLMKRLNNMLYDLMNVFAKQHYVHHAFMGGTSIKYILPVVASHLSYEKLNIKEGADASNAWFKMVGPIIPDREKEDIARDLKTYCTRDTLAMYEVWKHLEEL
ncbi:MAG TPA: DUF2779 domain-containing protein [Candidatus Paceibacterota bacterium]